MATRNWTPPQQAAIEDRGGTLLLSAAAGSGKTAVLVERVVSIICDHSNPVDVNRLLIVTFSNAAAAEMKQRIGARLSEMILETPEDLHLQRQQNLLSSAPIRTIHAFCMDLIRENFQNLPITSDFSIMDEKELDLMKADAVTQCIEELYQADETGVFSQLVDLLSTGRDDRRLIETVYKIYNFARSHPFYESWLDRKLAMYDENIPVSQTVWGEALLSYTKETLDYCKDRLEKTKEYIMGDEKLETAYLPAWESDLAQINNSLDYMEKGNWDGAVMALRTFSFERLKSVRGDDEGKQKAQDARNQVKKRIPPLAEKYLNATEEEFRDDIRDLRPKIEILFGLVKSFGNRLGEQKRQGKKLDFSDLEHFALELLVKKVGEDYQTTPQGELIANQFDYVLVDEYQDTNEVQDLIFTSLSGEGRRLFMVGDVKQSIYSFRLAMPEIFMNKKEVYFPYNKNSYPATISLDTNFRSRNQVIDGVNFIFSQIMSPIMGEIDYNKEESLKCGATYPEYPLANPELLLINGEDVDSEEDGTYLEAREVARKIKKMLMDGYQVADGQHLRPAVPGDFCILMRSPRTRADIYMKALQEQGLHGLADSSGGFFEAREISVMLSFLMALDNPLLDVELAAAMLSPLFAFSDDELADIRLLDRRAPLYTAVKQSAKEGNEKSKQLLELFSRLRYFSTMHQADELILEIYRTTNWLEISRAMPFGEGRQANLLLLVEYAGYYHSMGYKGLCGFCGLMDRIKAQGNDLDSATISGEGSNVVQIISVHRSKGLEFPIVILADTSRRFNKRDLYENTLLHFSFGFACMRRNTETMSQYPTIPMGAIRLEMQKTMISEEMRIFYVALTRAREKLIISTYIKKNMQQTLAGLELELSSGGKLPPFMVGEANSYADWVLMTLLHHPSCEKLRELSELDSIQLLEDDTPWVVDVVSPVGEETEETEENRWEAEADEELETELKERIDYQYPYLSQTITPNKLAVSQVSGREQDVLYRFARRPKFMLSQKLTPAEKGNAMHKFMQFSNYKNARDHLEDEILRMERDEYLTATEVSSLSEKGLADFFQSNLAERLFTSEKVLREFRFITEFGKEELEGILPHIDEESRVVLQGVADCVFFENGQAFIVDYKTDRVLDMEELSAKYREQIKIYRKILSRTLEVPIAGCILYSFALSRWIEV